MRRRRRRLLLTALVIAALGLVGAGANRYVDQRAERQAAVRAATGELRQELAGLYEAMADATTTGAGAGAALRRTLQEHLTVSRRSDQQLATDRKQQQATLTKAGGALRSYATRPAPKIPQLVDQDAVTRELAQLERLKQAGDRLGRRFVATAASSQQWADALARLRAQAGRYVATVEAQPETHDPAQLTRLWQSEKQVLADYRAAAQAAARVAGLQPLAEAYLNYVQGNLRFIDDAVRLLNSGRIQAYNRRLRDTFTVADPFGFQASVDRATRRALNAGVIAELAKVRAAAADLGADLQAAASGARSPDA